MYTIYTLENAKPIHKGRTHPLNTKVEKIEKKISGRDLQGTWHRDELIGGKPPVLK
jgi:hypothetical protein